MRSVLPPASTRLERAAEAAIGEALETRAPLRELQRAETCPPAALPHLAWAESVDAWDPAWTDAEKRDQVAASPERHRRKGTRGALRRALDAVRPDVSVHEWFEAQGTGVPHTARVVLEVRASKPDQDGVLALDAVRRATEAAKRGSTRVDYGVRVHLRRGLLAAALLSRPLSVVRLAGDNTVLPRLQSDGRVAAHLRAPVVGVRLAGSHAPA